MNEINEEIKLTLNLMQTDIDDDAAHGELQGHLYSLLEMKRNELQKRLTERSWSDPVTHDEAKPLTTADLLLGGWWCADTSNDALEAFLSLGLKTEGGVPWDGSFYGCFLYELGSNLLDRGFRHHTDNLKQIERIGNEFYWSENEAPK